MAGTTKRIKMNQLANVRKMTTDDLEAVHRIECSSFPNPWTKEAFMHELFENQYAHYFVIEMEEEIVGYCGLWVVFDDAQITNIAVLPTYRGQKLGETLLSYVMRFAKECEASQMTLEVRVSNLVAQALYKKLGFKEIGIRKNYYSDNQEDALLMWVNLHE